MDIGVRIAEKGNGGGMLPAKPEIELQPGSSPSFAYSFNRNLGHFLKPPSLQTAKPSFERLRFLDMDAIALALSATRAVDSTVQLTSTVNINTEPVSLLDPTVDSITTNAIQINSRNGNDRLTYLMERLTTHLHEFARETRLTTEEWMAALEFLVECGKISDDNRQVGPIFVLS